MTIIDALKSQDYATLKNWYMNKFRERLGIRVQSKMDEYKAKLVAVNADLKAKINAQGNKEINSGE